jgi:hypothetical protein
MSLLDGLTKKLSNPIFESTLEDIEDDELNFDMILESVVDKKIKGLTPEDIEAILDDDNPDNIAADLNTNDEQIADIEKDAEEFEIVKSAGVLESLFGSNNKIKINTLLESLTEFDDDDDDFDDEEEDYDDEDNDESDEESADESTVNDSDLDELLKDVFK